MGSDYRSIVVHFEYCASPLCPIDLLPWPKIEENQCGANYPTANSPYLAAHKKQSPCLLYDLLVAEVNFEGAVRVGGGCG